MGESERKVGGRGSTIFPASVDPRAKINATGLQSPFFRSSELMSWRRSRVMSASAGSGDATDRAARAATRIALMDSFMAGWAASRLADYCLNRQMTEVKKSSKEEGRNGCSWLEACGAACLMRLLMILACWWGYLYISLHAMAVVYSIPIWQSR
jgi:hypothetical protein